MGSVAESYRMMGLIEGYTTQSVPENKQLKADKGNNIVRGFSLSYCLQQEIEEIYIHIREDV